MDTFISTTKLILILTTMLLVTDAQDVVCKKGRTKKKVMIGEGDLFSFRTQAGDDLYAPNTKCVVTYKRKKTCPMMMFTCSFFNINNKDSSCKKKDKMILAGRGRTKSFCQTSAPDVTTSSRILKVSFFSDRKKQAPGAVCTVQCTTGPITTTTTTTVEPDTTTTTTEQDTTTTTEPTTTTGPTTTTTSPQPRQRYLMYSWATMWSGDCGQEQFLAWDEKNNPGCFTSPWHTMARREKLWCTCNRPGREIGTLLLYGMGEMIDSAMAGEGCEAEDISLIRTTLAEGHSAVANLEIYALLSWGESTVPEQHLVPGLVWYNQNCAKNTLEKLDGVAVNNEDFAKHGSEEVKVDYLKNLANIAENAGSELKTHYSVSWNWFTAGNVTFNGKTQNVLMHMIDIFDSIDMQTAYVLGEIIVDRLQKGFNGTLSTPGDPNVPNSWSYSQSQNKTLFTTLYLNKDPSGDLVNCPTAFFPWPECKGRPSWDVLEYQTEDKMWEQVDSASELLPGFTPSLHYYGGAYQSGGHPDWPTSC